MKYTLATLIYWPIWIGFREQGFTYFGMMAGGIAVLAMLSFLWKIEFGSWKFWSDK